MNSQRILVIAVTVALCSSAIGCASSTGSHRVLNAPAGFGGVQDHAHLAVSVDAASDVKLGSSDRERIRDLIMKNFDSELNGRFTLIHDPTADTKGLDARVVIVRYDEGNAFARMMLAGLGAMHIDAEVTLVDRVNGSAIARYEVTKTFGWGGAYGAGTKIQDIEDGFAKAVVAAIGEQQK